MSAVLTLCILAARLCYEKDKLRLQYFTKPWMGK